MGRLFGTDGIRGIANKDLDCELATKLGRAAARVLINKTNKNPRVIIGKDTRLSSDMLEAAMAAGLCSVGASVIILGVVPTPAVAYLVEKYKADAGIMISASHNSYEYNGIKIFSGDGYKLPDYLEEKIEDLILGEDDPSMLADDAGIGTITSAENAVRDYIDHVKSTIHFSLDGMEVALDCSHGSSSATAETLFTELGAKVHILNAEPDGINVNDNCGSTHMEGLCEYVKTHENVVAGLAFDGDADRCLAVDENGEIIDGDFIMAICALDMKSRGKLAKDTVVGTILTNLGLVKFCEDNGMRFEATKVGDRYVLEEMLLSGYSFGGEQSGHVICRDFATTGDGQLTGAQLLSIVRRREAKLSSLATVMSKYPQVSINIKVSPEGKRQFFTDLKVKAAIDKATKELADTGRIIVRPSGTEPLLRVMVEGQNDEQINRLAEEVADVIRNELV